MTELIAVEEHYATDASLKAATAQHKQPADSAAAKRLGQAIGGGLAQYAVDDKLIEPLEDRLAFMDAHNIKMQVLSDEGLEGTAPDKAVAQAQAMNDHLGAVIQQYPTRFSGFAALPVQNGEAAAAELERAVKGDGLKGAMIHGRVQNQFLDAPQFTPIFEKAAKLDVPIYIHPGMTASAVLNTYYLSDQYPLASGGALGLPGFGWHAETGLQFVRLVLAGRFDQFPNLKIMMGHWGELVSFYMHRMDETIMPTKPGLKHDISYYFHHNLYVSPSGLFDQNQLQWAVNEFGADHILFSTDYPYEPTDKIATFLDDADLTQTQRDQIGSGTAKTILQL